MKLKALVELVVRLVLKELQGSLTDSRGVVAAAPVEGSRLVVLVTGRNSGDSLLGLEGLAGDAADLKLVLSRAASSQCDEKSLKAFLGERAVEVLVDDFTQNPHRLALWADALIVPRLSQNTAAKVAHLIEDTLASSLILAVLGQGKPVLASPGPELAAACSGPDGRAAPGLIKARQDLMKGLESIGIQFVDNARLGRAARQLAVLPVTGVDSPEITRGPVTPARPETRAVYTQEEVNSLPEGTDRLVVPRGTVITPLAKDLLCERGIELVEDHQNGWFQYIANLPGGR